MAAAVCSNSSWQSLSLHSFPVPHIIQYKCSNPYHAIIRYQEALSLQELCPQCMYQRKLHFFMYYQLFCLSALTSSGVMTRAQGQVPSKELNKLYKAKTSEPLSVQSACTTVIKMLIEAVVPASPHRQLKSINQGLTWQRAGPRSMLERYLHTLPKMCP